MRVQDIMTSDVVTIDAHASVDAARGLMKQQAIRHLVVLDGKAVVGVLSARDVGRPRRAAPDDSAVSDVMATPAVTVPPTDTVKKAANVMRGRSIGSLVVVAKNRPIGIVTVSDLLDYIGRGGARTTRTAARPVLHHRVPHRKRHGAAGAW
jgi:CBS domain-containing protein